MRRVLLLLTLLAALTLSTALASSLDVQADNLESWQMEASISVPTTTTTTTAPTYTAYYFRGSPKANKNDPFVPGQLDRTPTGEDNVQSKKLLPRVKTFEEEDDEDRYHVWQSPPVNSAAVPPYVITVKSAKVFAYQNGGTGDITVGLFACPGNAAPYSGAGTGCDLLTKATATGSGDLVEIPLPALAAPFTVAETERLRVKIVNDNDGTNDFFNVQWGYKSNRPSRVEIAPT